MKDEIFTVVGAPQIGKPLFEVTCEADGKTYLTTNESTARRLLDKVNGAPVVTELYKVKLDFNNRVKDVLN